MARIRSTAVPHAVSSNIYLVFLFIVGVALSSPSARLRAERLTSAPTATAAQRQALRVQVRAAGMQRISSAHLAHLGASRVRFDPAQLQLHHASQEIALQLLGAEDGRLSAGDELRFYAPDPGDRWNGAATYWLTVEDQPGQRIERRDSGPGSAPQRSPGYEAGRWQPRTSYDSTRPGPDGDHWFAVALRSGPDQEAAPITIPLTTTLPIGAGSVTLTITGSAATPGPHQVQITAGSATTSAGWQRRRDADDHAGHRVDDRHDGLLPAAAATQLLLDRVAWTRPVRLAVGTEGAIFQGAAGSWDYQLGGLADDQALYDVTDPAQPVEIGLSGGGFAAGPAAHRSLVTGAATLHTPEVQRHPPIDRVTPRAAEAVYVAPAAFLPRCTRCSRIVERRASVWS